MTITYILKSIVQQAIIRWSDLYDFYDNDKDLKGNLRKVPKLSYVTLHPGNNKQNVALVLAVIYETTIIVARNYFPNRRDVTKFLEIFNAWWTISNFKKRFAPNVPRNTVINGDKKTEFLRAIADWIEQWCQPLHSP